MEVTKAAAPESAVETGEFRGRIYDSILETIGATPIVRVKKLAAAHGARAEVAGKCEFFNPLASVKDRIGLAMIEALEREGKLKEGGVIVEPTSGNTGIALAFVCAGPNSQPSSRTLSRPTGRSTTWLSALAGTERRP